MAPNPKTLFHLVPTNQVARDALLHPDNKRNVSQSSGDDGGDGLEIGYHVPSLPQGHVITRLGRNTDLILRGSTPRHPISAVHVAFEINPATHLVVLSVRSKRVSSVSFEVVNDQNKEDEHDEVMEARREPITGDGVLLYGQTYIIRIGTYAFRLVWRVISGRDPNPENVKSLKALAIQSFQTSLQQLRDVRSRDRPTEYDNSEHLSWHVTRLNTAKRSLFEDHEELREKIGSGAFGNVFKAIDKISGHNFAIKVVRLDAYDNLDTARALIHKEIKVMEKLRHKNIIEYLGYQDFDTHEPKILMPLCNGNLTSLAQLVGNQEHDALCLAVLEHGLAGLDYLASLKLIHRDIKPDNLLYRNSGPQKYLFQLADFGLAHHDRLATTFCGTGHYQAPELWPAYSNIIAQQSTKMDIWSLFASIVAVHSNYPEFPPRSAVDYGKVLNTLRAVALRMPRLEAMARLRPERRASAAQLLVLLFDGKGLTTDRSQIPDIGPDVEETAPPPQSPSTARPSNPRRTRNGPFPTAAYPQLIVYPPRKHRPRAGPGYLRPPEARVAANQGGNLAAHAAPPPQLRRVRVDGGVIKRQAAVGKRPS